MNIAISTDDKYAIGAYACITSILENHKEEQCKVFVLTFGLSKPVANRFEELAVRYNRQIEIIVLSNQYFEGITSATERFPMSANIRILIPRIIKSDRVLYLDCDIIVRKNLHDFYYQNLDEKACAVVENQNGDDIRAWNRIGKRVTYFNSGVLLMNLNYWRANNVDKLIIKFLIDNPNLLYPDQDALNAVLSDNVIFCSYEFNFQEKWYGNKYELMLDKSKWIDIDKYKQDPAIVHYTSSAKPWTSASTHPHIDWYKEYAAINQDFFESQKDDNNKPRFLYRMFNYLIRKQQIFVSQYIRKY